MIKVEVWSDYVCPFCYIGKRRLEQAISQFSQKDKVEVIFKSYELQPDSPKDIGMSMNEVLANKYGMSVEEAKNMTDGIAQQAAAEGLTYRFDTMIPTNTFNAHRLAKFAESKGKEAEMNEKLLHAYFTESKHIGDNETLAELATSVDLDKDEVLAMLNNASEYEADVRADQQRAQQIGVKGVPFFVLNEKFAISGAQTVETFVRALEKAWEDAQSSGKLQNLSETTDTTCTDEGCAIPDKQ